MSDEDDDAVFDAVVYRDPKVCARCGGPVYGTLSRDGSPPLNVPCHHEGGTS